jgi:hypothetical protein
LVLVLVWQKEIEKGIEKWKSAQGQKKLLEVTHKALLETLENKDLTS